MGKSNSSHSLSRRLVYIVPGLCMLGAGFLALNFGFGAVTQKGPVGVGIFSAVIAIIGLLATFALFRLCKEGLSTGKLPWELQPSIWYWGLLSAVISLLGLFLVFLYIVMALTHQYI